MAEPVYISRVYIERRYGPVRIAHLPSEDQPITFSVHRELAKYCDSELTRVVPSHASTLDYMVAATGASLIDTLGSALEKQRIDASHGRLTAEVRGKVGATDDGVLVIKKIEVDYRIIASEPDRPIIHAIHETYMGQCAMFRTLAPSVEFASSYTIIPESNQINEKWSA